MSAGHGGKLDLMMTVRHGKLVDGRKEKTWLDDVRDVSRTVNYLWIKNKFMQLCSPAMLKGIL